MQASMQASKHCLKLEGLSVCVQCCSSSDRRLLKRVLCVLLLCGKRMAVAAGQQ
jgi:hypothetical protein